MDGATGGGRKREKSGTTTNNTMNKLIKAKSRKGCRPSIKNSAMGREGIKHMSGAGVGLKKP